MTEIGAAIGYGMQKFHEAVDALIWLGNIQERLRQADGSLSMLTPDHHLPSELRPEFRALMEDLDQAQSASDEEATALAGRIVDMARKVDKEYWRWEESV